jgi:hypothetical protein
MVKLGTKTITKGDKMKEVDLPIKFTTPEDIVCLKATKYTNNGRIAIIGEDANTGEPYFTLTVNVPQEPLKDNEFFIKVHCVNEPLFQIAFKTGMFINTRKSSWQGFPVWTFTKEIQDLVEKGMAE